MMFGTSGGGCEKSCASAVRVGTVITIAPISWPHHEDPFVGGIYPAGLCALYEESALDVAVANAYSIELSQATPPAQAPWHRTRSSGSSLVWILLGHHGLPTGWRSADTVVGP